MIAKDPSRSTAGVVYRAATHAFFLTKAEIEIGTSRNRYNDDRTTSSRVLKTISPELKFFSIAGTFKILIPIKCLEVSFELKSDIIRSKL